MKVVAIYDFNNGERYIKDQFKGELDEVFEIINAIDSEKYKLKLSKEKTMLNKLLYSPSKLNKAFSENFIARDWHKQRELCEYKFGKYLNDYVSPSSNKNAFREMDFIKNSKKIGVEVQFGKYAFMVYNVCAKMTIFSKLSYINAGIEIVPVKNFANDMSTGVSYFEQFAWDLHFRGVSNIDIPVLIIGIDK